MPEVRIEYEVTSAESRSTRLGTRPELIFVPYVMARPKRKTKRVDAKGIGTVESTLLYSERSIVVSVRCIPLGLTGANQISGDENFDEFFASAADGQPLRVDASSLPHYGAPFYAQLAAGEYDITPIAQAAAFSKAQFVLELPRTR